jgi:hypothetical protein
MSRFVQTLKSDGKLLLRKALIFRHFLRFITEELKARQIILTKEGAALFKSHCTGRAGSEVMFTHADGSPWKTSEQDRPNIKKTLMVEVRFPPT